MITVRVTVTVGVLWFSSQPRLARLLRLSGVDRGTVPAVLADNVMVLYATLPTVHAGLSVFTRTAAADTSASLT